MSLEQPKNPLHGIKLANIVTELVAAYGWDELAFKFDYRCFYNNPTIKSSLKFLRKELWAREEVENFYLIHIQIMKERESTEEVITEPSEVTEVPEISEDSE